MKHFATFAILMIFLSACNSPEGIRERTADKSVATPLTVFVDQPGTAEEGRSSQDALIQELESLAARHLAEILSQPGWLHLVTRHQRPVTSTIDWEALPEKYEQRSWLLLDSQGKVVQAAEWVLNEAGQELQVRLMQHGIEANLSLGFERPVREGSHYDPAFGFIEQARQLVQRGSQLNKQILYNNCWYVGEGYMLTEPGLLHEAVFNPDNGELHSLKTWKVSSAGLSLVSSLEVAVEENVLQPPAEVLSLFGQASEP